MTRQSDWTPAFGEAACGSCVIPSQEFHRQHLVCCGFAAAAGEQGAIPANRLSYQAFLCKSSSYKKVPNAPIPEQYFAIKIIPIYLIKFIDIPSANRYNTRVEHCSMSAIRYTIFHTDSPVNWRPVSVGSPAFFCFFC